MFFRFGVVLVLVTYTGVTSALPPCTCTRQLVPVCGTDGETYANICLLRCQQQSHPSLQLRKEGACGVEGEGGEKVCICTLEFEPVCGSDGVTYPNKCALDCEYRNGVELAHGGTCGVPSPRR